MFLPRYSLRTILYLAVVVAVVAVVAGQAVRGSAWAIALTVGIGSLGVTWMVFASFYAIVTLYARVAMASEAKGPRAPYFPKSPTSAESPPSNNGPAAEVSSAESATSPANKEEA